MAAVGAAEVAERLAALRARITGAGGDLERVTVVAVTKGFGDDAVAAALAAGLVDVGENYAGPLLARVRSETLAGATPQPRWHLLGGVQRNKVGGLAPWVHCWQSVDREAEGASIARHAPGACVLVQVNLAGEPQKEGCSWDEAPGLVAALRRLDLDVAGLMGVGPAGDPEDARPHFRRLARLARDLGLSTVSMGMTGDLEVAVEEGATMVRVGRALFGPRPPKDPAPR